ncbi:MAG TPA: RQC domain-containing protein, partial [Pyrinomonadaceae bacterium]|nr:RQC domain-containing protein [Pyrinomonadaceae bacterium]
LFFSWGDVNKLKGFAEVEGNRAQTEIMLKKLNTMGAFGDLKTCRRKFLLNYFSEDLAEDCGHCDNCNTEFERFDGTIIAQKALSAVYRTGQRFGLSYLIDFLRGSEAKTIRDEHKNLKTYGVGADISKNNWFDYFKDLIAQGFLAQTEGQYPTIVLTEKSEAVLKGNVQVELFKVTIKEDKEDKKASLVSDVSHPYIKDLFNDLKQIRTAFARSENVPPYVVFSDATLVEFATYLPQNDSEMRKISGVGELKLQKYGADFLREIKRYCEINRLASRINLKTPKREPKKRTKRDADGNDTYSISLDMYKSGLSIEEIAESRGMAKSTIETHLIRFIQSGEIMLDDLVLERKIEPIRNAVLRLNAGFAVAPVKEFLGEDYSYAEIRAVMVTM